MNHPISTGCRRVISLNRVESSRHHHCLAALHGDLRYQARRRRPSERHLGCAGPSHQPDGSPTGRFGLCIPVPKGWVAYARGLRHQFPAAVSCARGRGAQPNTATSRRLYLPLLRWRRGLGRGGRRVWELTRQAFTSILVPLSPTPPLAGRSIRTQCPGAPAQTTGASSPQAQLDTAGA